MASLIQGHLTLQNHIYKNGPLHFARIQFVIISKSLQNILDEIMIGYPCPP